MIGFSLKYMHFKWNVRTRKLASLQLIWNGWKMFIFSFFQKKRKKKNRTHKWSTTIIEVHFTIIQTQSMEWDGGAKWEQKGNRKDYHTNEMKLLLKILFRMNEILLLFIYYVLMCQEYETIEHILQFMTAYMCLACVYCKWPNST